MISSTIHEIAIMTDGELFINKGNIKDTIKGVTLDSRFVEDSNIFIAIKGVHVDGHAYLDEVYQQGASLAIIDDCQYCNVDIPVLLVKDSVEALQKLAKNYRQTLNAKVIAITGSNGKTSCKDLMAEVLKSTYKVIKTSGNQNNELGVPLTLLRAQKDTEIIVLEMGMENLEDIHFLNNIAFPDIGIVTNVGIAHLENLGSLENIGRAKLELMDGLKEQDLFIYNGDDSILKSIINEKDCTKLNVQTFGEKSDNSIYLIDFNQEKDGIIFTTNCSSQKFFIPTIGKYMALNALPVIYVAHYLGLENDTVVKGLSTFVNGKMRNEIIKFKSMTILNDAYKSNPQSARVALDTFNYIQAPYKIIVLGDMLDLGKEENQFHFDLGIYMQNVEFDELIGYGELAHSILQGAKLKQPNKQYYLMDSHEKIIEYLESYKEKECAILFKGSRGMHLDKIVNALVGEK